jgi:hypothetical protein
MDKLAIVASLKSGAEPDAAALLAQGPPFEPGERGLSRHSVFLSAGEVVFVFEGAEVEWTVDGLVDAPYQWTLSEAFAAWRPLIEGQPRIARLAYDWQREADPETQVEGAARD